LGNKNILVGYSGHSYVVIESLQLMGLKIEHYTDISENKSNPFNLKYLGNENDIEFSEWNSKNHFILALGDNSLRKKASDLINSKGCNCLKVIHPNSSISEYSSIGDGTFIARGVTINPFVKIGKNCIINTGASIDHECIIGDNVHIAPNAVLAGNVKIGTNTFVGANAVIKNGVKIGSNVVIGAGSVVIKNIDSNKTVVGNPSREI
jgi:sugar O-acyltransferase (sialic acid O-acetyltransferase NeuD family)